MSPRDPAPVPPRASLLLAATAGFVVWSSALVALYAALSVGCEAGWPSVEIGPVSLQTAILAVLWLLHLAVLATMLRRFAGAAARPADPFLPRVAFAATAAALAATAFTGLPLLAGHSCL